MEDIRSTQISPGLHEIEIPQWDRRLHHGHTAFCTWLTIEDIDMDILETYHTILPIPTRFAHNRTTPAPHPYMSEPLYPN